MFTKKIWKSILLSVMFSLVQVFALFPEIRFNLEHLSESSSRPHEIEFRFPAPTEDQSSNWRQLKENRGQGSFSRYINKDPGSNLEINLGLTPLKSFNFERSYFYQVYYLAEENAFQDIPEEHRMAPDPIQYRKAVRNFRKEITLNLLEFGQELGLFPNYSSENEKIQFQNAANILSKDDNDWYSFFASFLDGIKGAGLEAVLDKPFIEQIWKKAGYKKDEM